MNHELSPIEDIQLNANGDAAHTATLTLHLRDAALASGLMGMLPPKLVRNPLTLTDGARIFLPIDGDLTSAHFNALLQNFGMEEDELSKVRPMLASAVAQAQAGAGLSEFHHTLQAAARML